MFTCLISKTKSVWCPGCNNIGGARVSAPGVVESSGDPSPCWPVSGLQAQERLQSSVTGGGMSCSWKFSFWKMLLKAGPLWVLPNGLQLSLLRFWESSVRRASCRGGDTVSGGWR